MRSLLRLAACLALAGLLPAQVEWTTKWIVQNRANHGMAYDSNRGRVIVFGGNTNGTLLDDTWEWDGQDWIEIDTPTRPGARQKHGMTYDAARGVVVIFGGLDAANNLLGDTWEYDGTTWIERVVATPPPAYPDSELTYDEARSCVVGLIHVQFFWPQVWEWDGTSWSHRVTLQSVELEPGGCAYDAARQVTVIALKATYLWDGVALTKVADLQAIDALAYDPLRARVVGYRDQVTYEWDGSIWTQTPFVVGAIRSAHRLAFDGSRVILMGGNFLNGAALADTWEWDGATWTRRLPLNSPNQRYSHHLSYDSTRERLVVFGGVASVSLGEVPRDDTWEWDGVAWTEQIPTQRPPRRESGAMAYFSSKRETVLFGGLTGPTVTVLGDTWSWDGTVWQQKTPQSSPSPRVGSAIAADSDRKVLVLFGGSDRQTYLGDTWEWDGSDWTQRFSTPSPSARGWHAMAYDPTRERTVLFGGKDDLNNYTQTWEWDGQHWSLLQPNLTPSPGFAHGMAYDTHRGRIVLFGSGLGNAPETWEWDGSDWTKRNVAFRPTFLGTSICYDAARRTTVLFGNQDTWFYGPTDPAEHNTSETGCPGTAGTPSLHVPDPSALTWLGEPFSVEVHDVLPGQPVAMAAGFSKTTWGVVPLPLSLNFIGMFGCKAFCEAPFFFPAGVANAQGIATWNLGVLPTDPAFLGFSFFHQAWVADPINPAGLITSDLGEAIVGGK